MFVSHNSNDFLGNAGGCTLRLRRAVFLELVVMQRDPVQWQPMQRPVNLAQMQLSLLQLIHHISCDTCCNSNYRATITSRMYKGNLHHRPVVFYKTQGRPYSKAAKHEHQQTSSIGIDFHSNHRCPVLVAATYFVIISSQSEIVALFSLFSFSPESFFSFASVSSGSEQCVQRVVEVQIESVIRSSDTSYQIHNRNTVPCALCTPCSLCLIVPCCVSLNPFT